MSSSPSLSASKKKHANVSDSNDSRPRLDDGASSMNSPLPSFVERQHLVGEVADQQAWAAGAVEVGGIHAHAGAGHAGVVEGHAGGDRFVHERALAGVAVQPVRLRVVGDEHVEPAVIVVVEQADAKALARRDRAGRPSWSHPRTSRCQGCGTGRASRPCSSPACSTTWSCHRVCSGCPSRVATARNWRRPGRACRPCRSPATPHWPRSPARPTPARCGHVLERALAGVAKQAVATECGDEQVDESVVVVVGGRGAHPVRLERQPRGLRDVGECAAAAVAIQRRQAAGRRPAGPRASVDEEEVLQAVVVDVEDDDAGAHGFGQVLLAEGAAVVTERDAGLRGDVGEGDSGRYRSLGRLRARTGDEAGSDDGRQRECHWTITDHWGEGPAYRDRARGGLT